MSAPPPFDAPWQADLFALTVAFSESGHFSWADWTAAFGATLARHGKARALDGGQDYYAAWLETFETLLAARGVTSAEEMAHFTGAWRAAYLATPHGQPVGLKD